ncbi:hypothetical protein IMW75_18420 [Pseudomonas gregormendelii]|uniref:Uncharacterized protein n=1 Tax=Pseudomonas gregormendelii TaxID=1628277 RepID=A0ABS3ALF5_9PSED|nr:hypothetical protein [Pseudomonas gregormendelii]MBN3967240.1 hypothetical protein [Pseudomonas gregormendelii]
MLHTTSVPAADFIRLSDLIKHYSQALACSHAAAAWELRETFAELAIFRGKQGQSDYLDGSICCVGTVARPSRQRGLQRISLTQLITYFDQHMQAGHTGPELIECGNQIDGLRPVAAAAVGFDRQELTHQLVFVERPFPRLMDSQIDSAGEPKGRRKGSEREALEGLIEIAVTAARKAPNDPFCLQVAGLDVKVAMGARARVLRELADFLCNKEFPSAGTIRNMLR